VKRETAVNLAAFALVAGAAVWAFVTYEPVRVAGGSMEPALRSGDVALVRREALPHPGDIALIAQPGHGPVLHRVIGRDHSGCLRTRGDANALEDFTPTMPEQVRGTVVLVVPVGSLLERWRQ